MKDLIIKRADLSRAEEIFNVLLKCSDETDFLSCSARERVDSGFTMDKFRNFLSSAANTDNNFFICLSDDRIIGMLGLHCETRERFSHRMSLGMNILKDYWGRGGGGLLMRKAVNYFNSVDHLTKLELEVRADNEKAIGLYKKFGFEIEGELQNHFCIDSKYYSAYKMALFKGKKKHPDTTK